MAFVLIAVGIILFVTAYQGTTGQLGSMLVQDVIGTQGSKGYLYWAIAILVVGAIGYIKALKGLSDAFVGLLLLVLFISNQGFFSKFNQALASIGTAAGTGQTSSLNTSSNFPSPGNNPLLSAQSNPLLSSLGSAQGFNVIGGSGLGSYSGGAVVSTGAYNSSGVSAGGWTDVTPLTSIGSGFAS